MNGKRRVNEKGEEYKEINKREGNKNVRSVHWDTWKMSGDFTNSMIACTASSLVAFAAYNSSSASENVAKYLIRNAKESLAML